MNTTTQSHARGSAVVPLLLVPDGGRFCDLKLERLADGTIRVDWGAVTELCRCAGIPVAAVRERPRHLVSLLGGWSAIAEARGQTTGPLGIELRDAAAASLDEAALADAGIRFEPPPPMPVDKSFPAAADTLASAVDKTSWGAFFRACRPDFRDEICLTCGSLCYAIVKLAPDILQRPAIRVVLGGDMPHWEADGGRWLSLFSRLLPRAGSIGFVLCTRQRPLRSELRPIQFFPAQRIVQKPWGDYLRENEQLPDMVVLSAPEDFQGHYEQAINGSFTRAVAGTVLLWAFGSEPLALIGAALVEALGYEVDGPVRLERTEGVALELSGASVYLRVRAPSDVLRELDKQTLERIRRAHIAYEAALGLHTTLRVAQESSSLFGRVATVPVQQETILAAAMCDIASGIDLATGRIFEAQPGGLPVWTDKRVRPELMQLCPVDEGVPSSRYELMAWIADAFLFGIDRDGGSESAVPVRPTAIRRRPTLSRGAGVTPVLAFSALLGHAGSNPREDDPFGRCQRLVVNWLTSKGFAIDPVAASIHAELPDGEVAIEAGEDGTWALRFDDRRTMDEGAFWRVEINLHEGVEPTLGVRLSQVRRRETAPLSVYGTPNIVREIAGEIGLRAAGTAFNAVPWHLADAPERDRFLELLESPSRVQPIVAAALPEGPGGDEALLSLACRLTGVAYVVRIDPATSRVMQVRMGRARATLAGVVRVYAAGFDRRMDPSRIPLWMADIQAMEMASTLDAIVEEVCAMSLEAVGEDLVPDFQVVRRRLADARIHAAQGLVSVLASSVDAEREHSRRVQDELQAALATYRRQLDETEQALLQALEEVDTARSERDRARGEASELRERLDAVRRRAAGVVEIGADGLSTESYPDSWNDLEEWVSRSCEGRLVVLPQAAKAARESSFTDIRFAYRVLELLGNFYVPMRLRSADDDRAREAFERARDALGVEVSGVGEAIRDHRYRKGYQRPFEGKTITLDQHVKRGNAFDPAILLRVYYWYDDVGGRVVIGHMPSHLTNRASH